MSGDEPPRENELKVSLLGRTDLELLLKKLGPPEKQVQQTNHYYDTPDHALLRRRMCLRLREEGGRFILALKRGRQWKEGYLEADQLEAELAGPVLDPREFDPCRENAPPMQFLRRELGAPRLIWLGCIRNTRRVYSLPRGIRLEVDSTEFPGGAEEYELEAEWPDREEVRRLVGGLLDSWGVRWEPQTKTKHQRFLEYLSPKEGRAE